MNYLENLPHYIYYHLAENLAPQDLESLARVSKKFNEIFNSDLCWLPIAQKLGVQKTTRVPQVLLNYLPDLVSRYLYSDYKHLVYKKIAADIQTNWPQEFLTVFNGAKRIYRVPTIEIPIEQIIREYSFQIEHFMFPITKVAPLIHKDGSKSYFMLFRIRNNETQEIYHEAVSFYEFVWTRFFDLRLNPLDKRVICPSFPNATGEKIERLQRLINKEPVGLILEEGRYAFEEGPTTTSDGESVLELV